MAGSGDSCVSTIQSCLSVNNNERAAAEKKLYSQFQANPAQALVSLLQVISDGGRDDLKQFAAVFIRRALKSNKQVFLSQSNEVQTQIKGGTLQLIASGSLDLGIRKKLCDIAEVIAEPLLPQNKWPELLQFIQTLLNSNSSDSIVVGLYLLGLIALSGALSEQDIQQILQLLSSKFEHPDIAVRVENVKAVSRVAIMASQVSCLKQAVPRMFQLLTADIGRKAQSVLMNLTEIAKEHPELFESYLNDIHQLVTQLLNSPQVDGDTQNLALEFLVVLIEANPTPIRRNPNFISGTIDAAIRIMCSLQHDADIWNEDEDDADEQDFSAASTALNRLSEALGANRFVGPCKKRIDELLSRNEWNFRHAGLTALLQVMEALKQKKARSSQLLPKVQSFISDPHPRVRFAAISCIAIMCNDFGGRFISRNADVIVNSFFSGMQDSQNPRLQSLSTKCIVNFCERASRKTFLKQLNRIIEVLIELSANSSVKYVQEQICSVMAEVANTAGKDYQPYYQRVSANLIQILQTKTSDTDECLKMEAFRCLSYLGRAVGPDMFAQDAAIAMKVSETFASLEMDTMILLSCWGRIAETLRSGFQPYLLPVVKTAATFAVQQIEQTNYNSDEDCEEEHKFVKFNDKVVAIDVNKLEEKESGLILLGTLATSCPVHFADMLEEAVKVAMPLLEYPLSTAIRLAALESMTGFVQCAIDNVQKHQEQTVSFFLNFLDTCCGRLMQENETKVMSVVAYSIYQIISNNQEFAKAALTTNSDCVKKLIESLIYCVKVMNERINTREAQMVAPDLDEEDKLDLAKDNESERDVSQDVTDAIKSLLELFKEELLPLIMMSDFEWMISDEANAIQRCTVLRIFCYIFETCPSNKTVDLMGKTISRFIQCMDEEDCDVRQAAVYAIGLVVEQIQNLEPNLVTQILEKCFNHFDNPIDNSAHDAVLDNDASTIGKIIRHHSSVIPKSVYMHWLQKCFPIREDAQEGKYCYEFFSQLIQNQNADFLGKDMSNLPIIMDAMVDAFGTSLMNENTEKFLNQFVCSLKQQNEGLFSRTLVKMKEEQQRKLMRNFLQTEL